MTHRKLQETHLESHTVVVRAVFANVQVQKFWVAKIKKIYIWRVQMQKPLSAIWNFLLEWSFLWSLYI